MNEADTCRKFVVPKLQAAGWDNEPNSMGAQRWRSERNDFFEQHGQTQFVLPDVLKVPPVSDHGQIGDITKLFGGADKLRGAVNELQTLLYAA